MDCFPDTAAARDEDLLALIRRYRHGRQGMEAASALLARYEPHILRWCGRYARSSDHARDLAQDVMARAYVKLNSYEGRSTFSSWFYTLAHRQCLNETLRPHARRSEHTDPDCFASPLPNPESLFFNRLDEQTLLRLIRMHLAPVERRALWMRCVEKRPLAEITVCLGIRRPSGARAILQRGRRKLRRALREQGGPGAGRDARRGAHSESASPNPLPILIGRSV